jgi:hypothetical protein
VKKQESFLLILTVNSVLIHLLAGVDRNVLKSPRKVFRQEEVGRTCFNPSVLPGKTTVTECGPEWTSVGHLH